MCVRKRMPRTIGLLMLRLNGQENCCAECSWTVVDNMMLWCNKSVLLFFFHKYLCRIEFQVQTTNFVAVGRAGVCACAQGLYEKIERKKKN